jgi:hypothetical protein
MLLLSDEDDFDVWIEWALTDEVAHVVNRTSLKPIFNKEKIEHAQVQENARDESGQKCDCQDFQGPKAHREFHFAGLGACWMKKYGDPGSKTAEAQFYR